MIRTMKTSYLKNISSSFLVLSFFILISGCGSPQPSANSLKVENNQEQKKVVEEKKSSTQGDNRVNTKYTRILQNCFKTGEVLLQKSCIKKIKVFLEETPLVHKRQIIIESYTDKVGDSQDNLNISIKRALMAAKSLYFKEYKHSVVYYQGFGEKNLVHNSEDEIANITNRRLVVTVKDKKEFADKKKYNKYIYKKKRTTKKKPKLANKAMKDKGSSRVNLIKYTGKPDTGWIYFGQEKLKNKFNISCAEDKVRKVKRRSVKGKKKEKFMDVAYNRKMSAMIGNEYKLRIAPIFVFEDGYLPENNPNVVVKRGKGMKVLTSLVNAYRGEKAMLYRVFINTKNSPKSELKCMDIVVPYEENIKKYGFAYFKKNKTFIQKKLSIEN